MRFLQRSRIPTRFASILILPAALFVSGCREDAIQLPPIVPDYGGQPVLYPGTVVARDLSTPDLGISVQFYGGLMNWSFRPVPNVNAAIAEMDGRAIAVFFEKPVREGTVRTPGLWIPAFSVEDLDPAVARFRAQGGTLLTQRLEMPERGEMVVLRDPQGAVFSVLVSTTGDPVPGSSTHPWAGEVLVTEEFRNSLAVYNHTLGLSVRQIQPQDNGGRHGRLFAGNHPIGHIASSLFENIPAAWIPILAVKDLDATAAQAESLGGVILLRSGENAEVPVVLVQDPVGALFLLQQSAPTTR